MLKHFFKKNEFENFQNFKSVRFGVVLGVDRITESTDEHRQKTDRRYNADPFIIRARVLGANYDKDKSVNELPNAFPLIPKHVSIPPKVGELVLLFFFSDDLKNSDRLYIGPMVSSVQNMFKEEIEDATSSFAIGHKESVEDISKIPEAEGIYPSNKDVSVQGRNNADISFGDAEIRIRAGKFVKGKPLLYNQDNPAYLQIKHDAPIESIRIASAAKRVQKRGSVANIVSNKINLLGHDETITPFDLADKKNLITDEVLSEIYENANPAVLGNKLIEYLVALEIALDYHIHNGTGNTWTDEDGVDGPVADFKSRSAELKRVLLSNNVRLN